MLDLLNTIVQWIITGLNNVFNIISSIPKYLNALIDCVNIFPSTFVPYLLVTLSAVIIIKIKRLII